MNWYKTIYSQETLIKPNRQRKPRPIPTDDEGDPIVKNLKHPIKNYDVSQEDIESQLPGMFRSVTEKDIPTLSQEEVLKYLEDDLATRTPYEEATETPETITPPPPNYPKFASLMQAFNWANENNEAMRIHYITDKHRIYLIRQIDPHGDFWARTTGNHILVTWDETVSGIRSFIYDNVQKFEFVGKKFDTKFYFVPR